MDASGSTGTDAVGLTDAVGDAMGFVGAGAVGGTLARALAARGARVAVITSRGPGRAEPLAASLPGCVYQPDPAAAIAAVGIVWLAVPDDAIAMLDAALPWQAGQIVLHLSGARGVDALARAAACGARVAALHPLMTFSAEPVLVGTDAVPEVAGIPGAGAALARLAGCAWALEAADEALAVKLEGIVRLLGGYPIRIGTADRVPYHIAAVLASNYVVALLGAAIALWESFGVASDTARDALLPLVRASVENVARVGPSRALTGPVARGDASTLATHMRWLTTWAARAMAERGDAESPDEGSSGDANRGDANRGDPAIDPAALLAAYRDLARLAIPLARGRLSPEAASALRAALGDGGANKGGEGHGGA